MGEEGSDPAKDELDMDGGKDEEDGPVVADEAVGPAAVEEGTGGGAAVVMALRKAFSANSGAHIRER